MDDLKLIKKHYGEKMMHLCRELFPTILEKEGLLYETLTSKFYPSKFLYDDLVEKHEIDSFKNLIYNLIHIKAEHKKVIKTPEELMDEAGYTLYECNTVKDVKQFEKYFEKNEKLCTFGDIEGRLRYFHVFFAVKKNVDEIKRENFKNPIREDEYGTSVISIQFSKGNTNTLSIKNRYNHTVNNPDATFSNNLDNIIEGLTKAFEEKYNLNINSSSAAHFYPTNYILANDGRYYRYNYEIDNIYYCPDNIIIEYFDAKKYDSSRYLIIDYFLIDFQEKRIISLLGDNDFLNEMSPIKEYDDDDLIDEEEIDEEYLFPEVITTIEKDSFPDTIGAINKIEVLRNKEDGSKRIIINNSIIIIVNKFNQIISYTNDQVDIIDDSFLEYNDTIKELNLPNVQIIGNCFLRSNESLDKLVLPKLISLGNDALNENNRINSIILPCVEEIGDDCFQRVYNIENLEISNVRKIGTSFMSGNEGTIKSLSLPHIEKIEKNFMTRAQVEKIYLPRVKIIEDFFLSTDNTLQGTLSLPNVEYIGDGFLFDNEKLERIELPNVRNIKKTFLYLNKNIREINMPKLLEVGDSFMAENKIIEKVDLPLITAIGYDFLRNNKSLKEIGLPNCWCIKGGFLNHNEILEQIYLPIINIIGGFFLYNNNSLKEIDFPQLDKAGIYFLDKNEVLERINTPSNRKLEGYLKERIESKKRYKEELMQKTLETKKEKEEQEYLEKQPKTYKLSEPWRGETWMI